MELTYIILMIIVVWFIAGFRIISQQTIGIVETFGKYSRVLMPGLRWIIPAIQNVVAQVSLKVIEVKQNLDIKTEDNQFVMLPVSLMIRVSEESAAEAYYKLAMPHAQISSWVLNSIRAITAEMTLINLFEDRNHIATQVSNELASRLLSFGYVLEAVLIEQPTLSSDVQASFNRVIAAKRECEAAEQEGEAIRIKLVKEAEAEAEAQRQRAAGLRDSRQILAEGLRDSIKGFENDGVDIATALDLLLSINRIDVLREASKAGNLILVDLEGDKINNANLALNSAQYKNRL